MNIFLRSGIEHLVHGYLSGSATFSYNMAVVSFVTLTIKASISRAHPLKSGLNGI